MMEDGDDDEVEHSSFGNFNKSRKKSAGSTLTMDTMESTSIFSPSICSDDESEDYFTKFNALSGWQFLILVQFQLQTKVFIIAGIYLAYIKCVLDAACVLRTTNTILHDENKAVRGIIYAFDLFYFLDVISMLIYKSKNWQSLTVRHRPRHGLIIFIEMISVIPLETIYTTMIEEATSHAFYCLRLRYALRWGRLRCYYRHVTGYVDANGYILHLIVYLSFLSILVVTFGSISYVYDCRVGKVTCTDGYDKIFQHIYLCGCRLYMIGITSVVESHFLNNVFVSLIPYLIAMYFTSFFIIDILYTVLGKFVHMHTFTWLFEEIAIWKKSYKNEWKSYYVIYELLVKQFSDITWAKTKGFPSRAYLGKVLPPIMFRELYLDISWTPLKHSHLFRDEDMFFLRALSSLMEHKYLSPGEIIYQRNRFKKFMVYVVSGIIEILSEEDGETPIFSLTSGTCLGESTLCISYPSSCTVIAKNTCDVAILYRKDFEKLYKTYPRKMKRVSTQITRRHNFAKNFRKLSLDQHKMLGTEERLGVITTKWLKLTLSRILFDNTRCKDLYDKYYLQSLDRYIFCSKYLDLLVKAEDVQLIIDSVFIKNTFPFIFKPDSVLLKTWDVIVLIILALMAISFPYYVVFEKEFVGFYSAFCHVVTFAWMVDIYLKSSTAYCTHSYVTSVQDIIVYRITNLTYILDVVSATPLEFFVYFIDGDMNKMVRAIVYSNRLLKFYRIHSFFHDMNVSVSMHIFLQYVKYGIYFSFLVYYTATVFHALGYRKQNATGFIKLMNDFEAATSAAKRVIICLPLAISYVGTTETMDFPFVGDWESCTILVLLQVIICIFYLLFLASAASGHRQMEQRHHNKQEFLRYLEITMKCFHFDKKLQERIRRYARLHLMMNDVYFLSGSINNILYYFPKDLVMITHKIAIGDHIRNQPLFFDIDEVVVTHICSIATYDLIPTGETIIDAGGIYKDIYILANGVCSVSYLNKDNKTIYSGECFSVIGPMLNIPSVVTVRALTTCKVITINIDKMKAVCLGFPEVYEIFRNTVQHFNVSEITRNMLVEAIAETKMEIKVPAQAHIKSFGYFLKKRTKKYFMFHEGFPKWASILKYLLLRHTFHCNGKFVFYWEIGRITCALLMCLLFPFTVLFERRMNTLQMILYFLDATAYVDIYMRHHFSYYNENGLEVYHPYYTAKYYWKHSLTIDFLACFPLENFASLFYTPGKRIPYYTNNLLQLYRYTAFCNRILSKKMKFQTVAIMFLPYIIIVINIATALSFVTFCDIDNKVELPCDPIYWIGSLAQRDNLKSKYENYVFLSLFPFSGFSLNSFMAISMHTFTEIILFSITVSICIFFHVFLIAKVIATSLTINTDLNSYQEAMHDMVVFMSYRKIEKNVRREIVNHFEYMWYKTRGKSIHVSFEPFKSSFKVEALYDIYGTRFKESSIFPSPNHAFFKSLLLDVKHEIYLKTGILYSVNDVHENMYLLLKGRVEVVGADFNKLLTLTAGSLFGHLDNCSMGRSTLSMVASGHVEVLKFPSVVFHAHLKKFPVLRKHFLKLIVFNVDYLEEMRQISKTETRRAVFQEGDRRRGTKSRYLGPLRLKQLERKKRIWTIRNNKSIQIWENIVMNIVHIIEYMLELYFIATCDDNLFLILLLYTCDLLYLTKIFIKFHTTFDDEFGQVVDSAKEIAKNYIRQPFGFYFDLATIIPVELVSLFFLSSPHFVQIWSVCRCNRLFRILPLLIYLRKLTQKLNINVLTIKSLYLLVKVILAQSTMGSVVQIMRVTQYNSTYVRLVAYSESLTMVTNACWRFPYNITVLPTKVWAVLGSMCIILVCKYMTWHFIAETCEILYVVNHTHHTYADFLIFMKRYMANEAVSIPLNERITSYIELLWTHTRGILFPRLLDEAPYYLKEAVLNSMFGFHITEHSLLKHCHKDLSRQMASRMKTVIFFPGDVITYIGDIDSCMYFIHEGEIHVLSEDTLHSEVIDTVLYGGDMFGLDQGLYEGCGHDYTYKASKYSHRVVLFLTGPNACLQIAKSLTKDKVVPYNVVMSNGLLLHVFNKSINQKKMARL